MPEIINTIISQAEVAQLSENLIPVAAVEALSSLLQRIKLKLALGNINLSQLTFSVVVKVVIEMVEVYIIKENKKHVAMKVIERLIQEMYDSSDKIFFHTMLINGVFESIVDLVVESSNGKLEINKKKKKKK